MATAELKGKTVAFLVAQEGVEEVELTEPWKAVEQAGGSPRLVAPDEGEVQTFNHLDKSATYRVDETLGEASRRLRRAGPPRRGGEPGPAPHRRARPAFIQGSSAPASRWA